MLLNIRFFGENILVILLIVLAVFIVKSFIAALSTAVLKYPPRTFLLTGIALFQVGEFAFILSKVGIQYGLLTAETNQYFLAVSIVSMLLTPFIIIFSENIAFGMMKLGPMRAIDRKMTATTPEFAVPEDLKNHLVIIGYGINGRNLAKAATFSKIPYAVIELNAETVRTERQKDIPILFGDATQDHMLDLVNIEKARVAVIAISDPVATKTIIKNIRAISQSLYLIVRTRFVKEMPELIALGADDVIPEEFETSIEIFSRTLHNFLVPEDDIEYFIEITRSNNYSLFQNKKSIPRTFKPGNFPAFNISCLKVKTDSRAIIGKTINELDVRNKSELNIVGIMRNKELISHLKPDEKVLRRDTLYVIGNKANIDKFRKHIE